MAQRVTRPVARARSGSLKEAPRTKRCPRCGQVLFADMDVCYGCLYNFSKQDTDSSVGLLVPDDWDAGMPPFELGDGSSSPSASVDGSCFVYGLRVRDASLEAVVPLRGGGITVGRSDECDIVLHAPSVSRQHVRIDPQGRDVLVTDLGSTNHARLEGAEVSDSAHMAVGSTLDVCGVLLTLVRW